MAVDRRLRAVVALSQAMASAVTPQDVWRAAARGACEALGGSFAALSLWERDLGRLRVLVNVGALAEGEEEFPDDETYPVHRFPEITDAAPGAWVETADPGPERTAPGAEGTGPGAPGPEQVETGESLPLPEQAETGGGLPEPAAGRTGGGNGGPAPGRATGRATGQTAPLAAAGTATDPRRQGARAAALWRRGRGSCVVAPVVCHGRAWGELYVARPRGAAVFDADDADFATVVASAVAAGIAQTERLEEVRRLAFTDPLTGLANRRAVDRLLDEAIGRHRTEHVVVSLVVCDLNGLKRVNDTQGHAVGDRLLERFATLLSVCGARLPGALAGRLGGDEFCLVTVGPGPDEVIAAVTELCARADELETGEGVACGMASTGDPIGEVRSARRLFRLADAAQYRAKAARTRGALVVAGRDDEVLRLAETPPRRGADRRRFRDA
ncbi:GGDEF domain-containing protein [Streptomyces sp. NPDC095613]|uniref:GGDEF domain-containing protein n=1 Tax=Streptomyces sp. NPDC095613 TaxID=3155540 RepID=UPI00332838BB